MFRSHVGTVRRTIKHWQASVIRLSMHLVDGDVQEEAKFNISPTEHKVFTSCYCETVIC